MKKFIPVAMIATSLILSACGNDKPKPTEKTTHSQVYTDGNHTYVRAYDPSADILIWYLLFANNQPASLGASSATWTKVSAPDTSKLTATDKVVEVTKEGEPQTEAQNASEVDGDSIVTEDTTADEASEQVDAVQAENDAAISDWESEGGSTDSGSDSSNYDGGDSSYDGGSDAGGGGDFGGGDAGGF